MEMEQTCCLVGHRPQHLPYGLDESHPDYMRMKKRIRQEMQRLFMEENVIHFITGMAQGTEQIGAQLVLELKKICPQITLECAIPYEEQAARWPECQRERYFTILASCDTETLLQTKYDRGCMRRKAEYMADHSGFVLAVWDGSTRSEVGRTIRYARKLRRRITIIHPKTLEITRENELNLPAD